jgi:hypothetical protein
VIPRSVAALAAIRKSSRERPCCRQIAATLSSRSAKRLPASLSDPKLPLRIIALVALARERMLDTVHVPAIEAREARLLIVLVAPQRGALGHGRGQPGARLDQGKPKGFPVWSPIPRSDTVGATPTVRTGNACMLRR